jgi:three-Cys-motif partner protein
MSKGGPAFFREVRQSAAILKHGVFRRYLGTFAGMMGAYSHLHQVGFIDGYAGSGVYCDPSGAEHPGSPKIALDVAAGLRDRTLVPTFIERGVEQFRSLASVVEKSANPAAIAVRGDVTNQLGPALQRFDGLPLLVFLDPFGSSLETDVIVSQIMGRSGGAATEVLLNFSMEALRRMGSRVFEAEGSSGREATLDRVDRWLGGVWWREIFESFADVDDRAGVAADAVFAAYLRRVNRAAGTGSFQTEVRRQAHHKPIFRLTLLFRSSHALMPFNEAVSMASQDWRKHLHQIELAKAEREDARTLSRLPGMSRAEELADAFEAEEAELKQQAITQIQRGILNGLLRKPALSVRDDFAAVFGEAVGEGRELHLRAAWNSLVEQELVLPHAGGKLVGQTILRATQPALLAR